MRDIFTSDFVFVPDGVPWPWDWVQRHPEHIVLPARFAGSPDFLRRMFGPRSGDPSLGWIDPNDDMHPPPSEREAGQRPPFGGTSLSEVELRRTGNLPGGLE